ncbi:DUF6153 family protein [Leifsonia sp. AG29]|uniref:DUF6153 family protein n=1 Tax=Leifsonia sp. AG29 TaxID=2598860 RepID=UPI00131CC5CB|nr:DUF6153 family protein [Leifsonia sp. AG29]
MLDDCLSAHTRTWRCVLVLLVAVAGIVTGILAMHVFSTPVSPPHAMAASHAEAGMSDAGQRHVVDAQPATQAASTSASGMTGGCAAGGCDPTHDMTAMVCTLALLGATILLIGSALTRAALGMGRRAAPATLIRSLARTIWAPPPSLLAFSVDRR